MDIDIIPFLCEGFSTNNKVYKLIDELYKKDKTLFYEAARKSIWYSHPIALEGSLEQEEYFKKSLGILLNREEYNAEIISIIIKGWKYVYTYAENHKVITLEDFCFSYIKKNKGLDNVKDDELNSHTNMLIAICSENIDTSTELYQNHIQSLMIRLDHYNKNCHHRINLDKASKDELKNIQILKNKLLFEYGDLKNLFSVKIQKSNLADYIVSIDFLFDFERFSLNSIVNDIKFTDKDLDEILYICNLRFDDNIDIKEKAKFIIDMIRIRYLCKAYKRAKEYHFKNNKETMFIEIESIERELRDAKKEKLLIQDTKEILQKQLNDKDKEINRLREELQKANENKKELINLREFLFNLDNDEENTNFDTYINYDNLKNIRGIVIGGHNRWQVKMKEYLPNCKFILPEMLNTLDTNIFNKTDIVFIYANRLNHALYYKIIDEIRIKNINLIYLKPHKNIDIVLKQVLKTVQLD